MARLHFLKVLIFLSFLFLSSFSSAQTFKVTLSLDPENYDENVKVSGQVRSGVMLESKEISTISLPPTTIYINLGSHKHYPESGDKHGLICGKLISADGKYEASFAEDQSASEKSLSDKQGQVSIELISEKYENKIFDEYSYKNLSVLAYESDKDCRKVLRIIPASWTEFKGSSIKDGNVTMAVYLNSGQFNTKLILYNDEKSFPLPCSKIEGTQQVAYDTRCEVSLNKKFDLTKTIIKRSNGGNYAKKIRLPIFFSPESQ